MRSWWSGVVVVSCLALGACDGGVSSDACSSVSYDVVPIAASGVGAGVFVGGAVWYDPGDTWVVGGGSDPGTADPGGSSGDVQPPDGTVDPGNGTPDNGGDGNDPNGSGDPNGDGSGDGTGDDGSGDGWARAHVHLASVRPLSVSTLDARGCYSCDLVCAVATSDGVAYREASGSSGASYDAACGTAQGALARWAHQSQHRALQSCSRASDVPSSSPSDPGRAVASPAVSSPPRASTDRLHFP